MKAINIQAPLKTPYECTVIQRYSILYGFSKPSLYRRNSSLALSIEDSATLLTALYP
ncbi:MAG: hypothetical protein QXI22_07190 [Sulfolobales archaeon]